MRVTLAHCSFQVLCCCQVSVEQVVPSPADADGDCRRGVSLREKEAAGGRGKERLPLQVPYPAGHPMVLVPTNDCV